MQIKPDTIAKLDSFISKAKFEEDKKLMYPGIRDIKMKPTLTQKINLAALDFKNKILEGNPTEYDYQELIEKGLKRFQTDYLDTEDSERVAHYFEELMDIVGLESSNGKLNDFIYSFDPNKKKEN